MSHDHDHDDDSPHEHDAPLSGPALKVKALESLLVDKGLVDPKALDELIDTYETRVGPRNGAKVVVHGRHVEVKTIRTFEASTAVRP